MKLESLIVWDCCWYELDYDGGDYRVCVSEINDETYSSVDYS